MSRRKRKAKLPSFVNVEVEQQEGYSSCYVERGANPEPFTEEDWRNVARVRRFFTKLLSSEE